MLSVIIPTYQEPVNSPEIGKIFTDLGYDVQIVISTDEEPHVGKGNAIKEAIKACEGEHILFMDADLQIPPNEVKTFFEVMRVYGADAVVGNKHHPFSNIKYTPYRKIISLGYRALVRTLFNLRIKDTQCGFKLFKKDPLLLVIDKVKCNGYSFDLELILALIDEGFRVVDSPVYVKRQVNRGSVSLKNIKNMFLETMEIWWRRSYGL